MYMIPAMMAIWLAAWLYLVCCSSYWGPGSFAAYDTTWPARSARSRCRVHRTPGQLCQQTLQQAHEKRQHARMACKLHEITHQRHLSLARAA